ncbi:MAG: GTPase HflX [Planctomycetota bacterium]
MNGGHSTAVPRRRVILVIAMPPDERELAGDREQEMRSLLDTADCDVHAVASQFLARPVNATMIGTGKIEEVRQLAEVHRADEVIFDCDLSPSQERNLEKKLRTPVVDYSGLILHIFAQNARTHQAQLAVELAQLEYNRSRLKRLWSHLDRIKAGTNMRGPGEKQLEVDRRLVDKRIAELKAKLEGIEARKERTIAAREDVKVCLVGYTNAGKSSLMNALTGKGVLAQDRLFATLDTRTARLKLDRRHHVVLSDTVGFIRKLPHDLIASFHATLSEVREADLLLHVVDASLPSMEEQIEAVDAVLREIGAGDIPTIMVFNKIDQDHSDVVLLAFKQHYPGSVLVSAHTGEGLDKLRERIVAHLDSRLTLLRVSYPITHGAFDAFLRRRAKIRHEDFSEDQGTLVVEADPDLRKELEDHPDASVEEVVAQDDGSFKPKPERFEFRF